MIDTTLKVDLGNGVDTVSWHSLNNLTESEIAYMFKNAKPCDCIKIPKNLFDYADIKDAIPIDCFSIK